MKTLCEMVDSRILMLAFVFKTGSWEIGFFLCAVLAGFMIVEFATALCVFMLLFLLRLYSDDD